MQANTINDQKIEYLHAKGSDYHFIGFRREVPTKDIQEVTWYSDVDKAYRQVRPVVSKDFDNKGGLNVCGCSSDVNGIRLMISNKEIGFALAPLPPKSSGNNSLRNRCLLVNRLAFREMAKLAGNGQEAVYDKLISLGILV